MSIRAIGRAYDVPEISVRRHRDDHLAPGMRLIAERPVDRRPPIPAEVVAEVADLQVAAKIPGVALARHKTQGATPAAVDRLIVEMDKGQSSSDRIRAAIAILDRGGVVPMKDVVDLDALVAPLVEAVLSALSDAGVSEAQQGRIALALPKHIAGLG